MWLCFGYLRGAVMLWVFKGCGYAIGIQRMWCSVSYTFLILGVFYHGTRFISILKYIVLSGVRGDRRSVTFC